MIIKYIPVYINYLFITIECIKKNYYKYNISKMQITVHFNY